MSEKLNAERNRLTVAGALLDGINEARAEEGLPPYESLAQVNDSMKMSAEEIAGVSKKLEETGWRYNPKFQELP